MIQNAGRSARDTRTGELTFACPDSLKRKKEMKKIFFTLGIFSKWRKIEVVKWAEDAIYAPIQTTDDKNCSLR